MWVHADSEVVLRDIDKKKAAAQTKLKHKKAQTDSTVSGGTLIRIVVSDDIAFPWDYTCYTWNGSNVNSLKYVQIPVHIHTYMHTYTHIHTCIHTHIHTYMFVVVNFDALAQASDIQIERRQVVFLCWKQDLNPEPQTPIRQQTECSLTNRLSYRGSS